MKNRASSHATTNPPPTGARERRLTAWVAVAMYTVVALALYAPALAPGRQLFGTDYLAGGYFVQEFVSRRLRAGELPLWIPHLYGGLPIFANPGSTYYLPRLVLDVLLPPWHVLPALLVFQLVVAGWGMYLLLRVLGTSASVAFLGGLAYELTGILVSATYAGHDGRMIVASWAPVAFAAAHALARGDGARWAVVLAGAVGGALLSFQIQSAYYLLLALALYATGVLIGVDAWRQPRELLSRVSLGLAAVALAFGLAAVNFLPFWGYIPESPRGMAGGRGYAYATSWSMPPEETIGLAVPEQYGISVTDAEGRLPFGEYRGRNPFKLHTEYVGAWVLAFAVAGVVLLRRRRAAWAYGGLALFALTMAWGGHTPLYRLYYEWLPGVQRFRAPSIAFYLVSFALVVVAALAVEELRRIPGDERARRRLLVAWGVSLGIAVLGFLLASGSAVQGWGRFLVFGAVTIGTGVAWSYGTLPWPAAAAIWAIVIVLDLGGVDRRFVQAVPEPDQLFAPDDVVAFLKDQPGRPRVWVLPMEPMYRGQSNYLMRYDIDQAGGEHGNQLQRWNEYVGAGRETYVDWHNFFTRAEFLDGANIRFVITGAPIAAPGFRQVHRGSAWVYENARALPRAYVVGRAVVVPPGQALRLLESGRWDPMRWATVEGPGAAPLAGGGGGDAQVVRYAPDRVEVTVRARGPSLLVLADNWYPGWQAHLDGRPVPVVRTNHTFRGVYVDAGAHRVEFRFRPTSVVVGLTVSVAAFVLWVVAAALAWARRRR